MGRKSKKPRVRQPLTLEERIIRSPNSARIQLEVQTPGFDPTPYGYQSPPASLPFDENYYDIRRISMENDSLGLHPSICLFRTFFPSYMGEIYFVCLSQSAIQLRRRASLERYNAEFPPLIKTGEQIEEVAQRNEPPKMLMSSLFAPKTPSHLEKKDDRKIVENNMFFGDEFKLWLNTPDNEKKSGLINRKKIFCDLLLPAEEEQTIYNNEEKLRLFMKNVKAIWEDPKHKEERQKKTMKNIKDPEDNICDFEADMERKRTKVNKHYAENCKCDIGLNEFVGKLDILKRYFQDCERNQLGNRQAMVNRLEHVTRSGRIYNVGSNIWHWLI